MEQIGVTAVVEGLSTFVSGMNTIQSSIEKIGPPASILQDAFGALGEAAGNFASWVADVLTYTLGNLLADAIETVISYLGEMLNKTIEAGNEFQTLTLRLNGINLDTLMKSGMDYDNAMKGAVEITKETLNWLQLLAMQTPFDNIDISTVYTMARTYGFADEQAKALTEDVVNVTAGMGLQKEAMKEIIRNLGQMASKGKITGREMTDLANRQVPIIDVLKRIAETLNKTGGTFTDASGAVVDWSQKVKDGGITYTEVMQQISKPITAGGGMDFKLFIDGFQQMADQEARFIGAGERMSRTFKAAQDNVNDLVTSFGGLNTVAPALDVLGGYIADFMNQFSTNQDGVRSFTELGERLKTAFISVGESLAGVVSGILGLAPSSDILAEGLVGGLESLATWLTDNKDSIVAKVKEIVDWFVQLGNPKSDFQTNVIQPIKDLGDALFGVKPGDQLSDWQLFLSSVQELGKAIWGVLLPVFTMWGLAVGNNAPTLRDFVKVLFSITQWINDHQTELTWFLNLIIALIIIQTVTNIVWGFIAGLVGLVAGIILVATTLTVLLIGFGLIAGAITAFRTLIELGKLSFELFRVAVQLAVGLIVGYFYNMVYTFDTIVARIKSAWQNGDWAGIGWAIVSGVASGISNGAWIIINAAQSAAMSAYNAAKNALGIRSPSTMFAGIGENLMLGMAEGIAASAGVAVSAMQSAVAAVSVPAMAAPSVMAQYTSAPSSIQNTYQQSNSYNLSIHSQAQTEQVAADFGMMSSLAGI